MVGGDITGNMDTITAIASGLKEQVEKCIWILAHPDKMESMDDFVIVLRKIAMDFLADEGSRDMVSQIALMLENSPNMKPADLPEFKRTWNYINNQMIIQTDYIIAEKTGIKMAYLPFKKGHKARAKPINLSEYAGMK